MTNKNSLTESLIKYYKVYVCNKATEMTEDDLENTVEFGFITDKLLPTNDLLKLSRAIDELGLKIGDLGKTLFSRKEMKDLSQHEKIMKQVLHYISFGTYGTQSINISDDRSISISIIKVVSEGELWDLIKKDIYEDKPLGSEKVKAIFCAILKYNFSVDFSQIKNRELRAYFIKETTSSTMRKLEGVTGEDVLRALILTGTESSLIGPSSLLINSKEVRNALRAAVEHDDFMGSPLLSTYSHELAQVYNRYKDILLSIKCKKNRTLINRIAKLSKKEHKPVGTPFAKTFIATCKKFGIGEEDKIIEQADKLSVTEKLRILDILAVKALNLETRTFMIRNGKVWTKDEQEKFDYNLARINVVLEKSLQKDLAFLKDKVIKYPKYLDYGLPISEKMSCGNVPFGTVVYRQNADKVLTAGMYWRNEWGSRDLDLSSISLDGTRVGWGRACSYEDGVIFSGDITNAPNGAIECIGNSTNKPVVLINNIFNGDPGTKFKVVIGEYDKDKIDGDSMFIEDTLFNFDYSFQGEKTSCVLGALTQDKFILYPAGLGRRRISGGKDNSMLRHIVAPRVTMKYLLEVVAGAALVEEGDCDIDLSVENITFQDLVNLVNGKLPEKELTKV